jgi:hypothetical protein
MHQIPLQSQQQPEEIIDCLMLKLAPARGLQITKYRSISISNKLNRHSTSEF